MGLLSEVRLERTLQVLSTTDNDAAADVLLEALVHAEPRWQPRVLEALLARRSNAAGTVVLKRWGQFGAHQKQLVSRRRGWISAALGEALTVPAGDSFLAACQAAREIGDYSQIPSLATAVMHAPPAPIREAASRAIVHLADRLHEELSQGRDYRARRGPQLARPQAVASLERGVRGFEQHGQTELIEALLLVADRRNATVSHILRDPSDRAFAPLLDLLVNSPRTAIMELLLDFLDDSQTPLSALHAMMRRRDARFVRLLCRKIGAAPAAVVRDNLRRIDNVPLLRQPTALLQMLDAAEQPGTVQLAMCSSIPRQQTLEFLGRVLQEGGVPGRRCAAAALAGLTGVEANAAIVRSLADDDGEVRAAAARQLRPRNIPDALRLLASYLDAPQPALREAARECLADITFDRYWSGYDEWDEEARYGEGDLTLRVDPQFVGKLVSELLSPSRSHQRKALEITQLLRLGRQVEPTLAELAGDEDQYVRLETVRLLSSLGTPLAEQILQVALHDKSALVQEAARQGLPELPPSEAPPVQTAPESPAATADAVLSR